jgi:hypothetical protein
MLATTLLLAFKDSDPSLHRNRGKSMPSPVIVMAGTGFQQCAIS